MRTIQKKQILMFSDGSILQNKTYVKSFNRIKSFNKDHTTFIHNKKNKNIEHRSKDLDHFKLKFFKF
jgi:hypothetical protein